MEQLSKQLSASVVELGKEFRPLSPAQESSYPQHRFSVNVLREVQSLGGP